MTAQIHPFLEKVQKAISEGKAAKAEALVEKRAEAPPEVQAHARALVQFARGKVQQGLETLNACLTDYPDYLEPWIPLAAVLRRLGERQKAVQCYENLIKKDDKDPRGYQGLAEVLIEAGDLERAKSFLAEAVTLDRDNRELALLLGKLLFKLGDMHRALRALTNAWEMEADEGVLALLLGETHARLEETHKAIPYFEKIRDPEHLETARCRIVGCTIAEERYDDAMALIEQWAPLMTQRKGDMLSLRGVIHVYHNRVDEGVASFREALSLNPRAMEAWNGLSSTVPGDMTDADVASLEELANDPEEETATSACFALAAVYEKRKQLPQQVIYLDKGNALKAKRAYVDRQGLERGHAQYQQRFTEQTLAEPWQFSEERALVPVFILGLPRSGTTLMEQVLSSHDQVCPAGETEALMRALETAREQLGVPNDAALLALEGEPFVPLIRASMRDYYFDWIARNGNGESVVTDKGINLFRYAGLLRRVFPEARFIAMQRDPVDVCFGAYKQLFAIGQNFTYSYADLAWAYDQFQKAIAHWHAVPQMDLLTLHYEQLVLAQEQTSRQAIAHAGLQWQDQVLEFQGNTRAVRTASTQQVRQGLFQDAIQRWKRYGLLLNPLIKELRAVGVDVEAYPRQLGLEDIAREQAG